MTSLVGGAGTTASQGGCTCCVAIGSASSNLASAQRKRHSVTSALPGPATRLTARSPATERLRSIATSTANRSSLGVDAFFSVPPMVEGIRRRVRCDAAREDGPSARSICRRGGTVGCLGRGVIAHLRQNPKSQRSPFGGRQRAQCFEELSRRHARSAGRLCAPSHLVGVRFVQEE